MQGRGACRFIEQHGRMLDMEALTELTLHNFRGFERLERMRLAPLTFLVGPNSSGKSSVADAMLFMAQSG